MSSRNGLSCSWDGPFFSSVILVLSNSKKYLSPQGKSFLISSKEIRIIWSRILSTSLIGIVLCYALCPAQPADMAGAREFGTFTDASAFAMDPTGNFFVLEMGPDRVFKLSGDGTKLVEIGGYGWSDHTFDHPMDICAQNGLDVYVADYNNHRIQRFDKNLNFVSSFEAPLDLRDEQAFGYPKSVAISNSGFLFFIDGDNKQIIKLTNANEIERTFGGVGSGEGKLENPSRIRVDAQDRVYVLDGRTIVVFDLYGNYLMRMGEGLFRNPSLFAIDQTRLYVLDTCNVLTLDLSGMPGPAIILDSIRRTHDVCEFRDIAVSRDSLYLLEEDRILVQPLGSADLPR